MAADPLSKPVYSEGCWRWKRCNESPSPFGETSYSGDDADLAKEMNELSVEEREQVYDDIHGVAKVVEETPEFIEMRIRQMDEFRATSRHKNMNRVFFLNPKLETDTEFKLMFLRADDYNPRKANERMGKYFDLKYSLFGEEKFTEGITINDLSEEEINYMRVGCGMELPWRDRVGRSIVFLDVGKADLDRMNTKSLIRVGHLICMDAVIHNEVSQRKGICCIFYYPFSSNSPATTPYSEKNTTTDPSFVAISRRLDQIARALVQCAEATKSAPVRFCSNHVCYNDPQMDFLVQSLRLGVNKATRFRLRGHLGSEIENEYKLQGFGIPTHNILQNAKKGDTTLHSQYIQRKQNIAKGHDLQICGDDGTSTSSHLSIVLPKSADVLMGRGALFQSHPGNQVMNEIMLSQMDAYKEMNRFEKTCNTFSILNIIQTEHGGRFLQRTKDGWKVLDDNEARRKIAIAFRKKIAKLLQK